MKNFITFIIMALIVIAGATVVLMMWNDTASLDEAPNQIVPTIESVEEEMNEGETDGVTEEVGNLLPNGDSEEVLTDKKSLVSTKWNWRQTNGPDQSILSNVPDNNPFVLTFSDETSFSSATDCNTMGGSYQSEADGLVFSDMFTTLMYCENSLEGEYGTQLREVEKYNIEGIVLHLYLKENKGVMVFEAVE